MSTSFARLAFPDAVPGKLSGRCNVCGIESATAHPSVLSSNFVELGLLAAPTSRVTCAPCTALFGRSPMISQRSGAALGWRMFSLFARYGHRLEHASKAAKPSIREWILGAPYDTEWGIAIADSGKKQLAPFAPVNAPRSRCRVLLESVLVEYEPQAFARHLAMVERLYALGFTKSEIQSGHLSTGRLRGASRETVLAFRELVMPLARAIDTPVHELAVWLAQKEEDHGDDDGDE